MTLNIGSMLVKAKFETGNMMSGLSAMNTRFRESQLTAKQATTAFGRMKGSLIAMGASAALTSGALLGMLMNAIMQSPFLSAAMEKLKNQMMLFGNAIARHLAPILEKVVDFVKWLREKFQALPEPIQAAIVKFAAIGIIILGLISTLGFLGLGLIGIKSGLIGLGLGSAATKLGTLATAFLGSTIAASLLGIGLGLVAGGLAVIVLDKIGVIKWLEELGHKAGEVDNKWRDMAISIGTPFAMIAGGISDLSRGDLKFTQMNLALRQGQEARHRYQQGVSDYHDYEEKFSGFSKWGTPSDLMHPSNNLDFNGPPESKKTEIASQNNYFDFSGLQNGTPEELIEAAKSFEETLAENQEKLNP